jgi:hypothetical protein
MVIEFDEKGKYFTEVITKNVVLSHIQTQTYHIRGYIHVRKDERLSDEVNAENSFIPVTNAEVYSSEGEILYTCNFMVVNRAHIVWLMPIEKQEKSE